MAEIKEANSSGYIAAEPQMRASLDHQLKQTTTAEYITSELYQDGDIILDTNAKGLEGGAGANLKTASDGHTVLVPQPSNDPNDPLNWSSTKKYSILFMLGVSAFMGDFESTVGVPCIIPQATEWQLTPNHVNYAGNLNVLLVGIGGLIFLPFFYTWGRAPVLFWTTFVGLFFILGSALVQNFNGYYALRALTGLFMTISATIGLSFIKDIFFLHQHARMIGIWVACFLASPYFGPMFGNFIIAGTGNWRNVYWMLFGFGCFQLLLILAVCDEPWYRRDIPMEQQPPRGNRIMRVLGVWQIQHHNGYFLSLYRSCRRVVVVLFKPIIIPILIYYLITFMWAVGINQTSAILFATPVAVGGYGFGERSVGYLFFTPVIGIILGETVGNFANDWLSRRYVRTHAGRFKPEARLTPIYFATVLAVAGLVLVGQALQKHLIWVALAFGWGMYVFAYMILSVAITAYALDSYPTGSGEVATLINFARLIGGFSVGYFQLEWGTSEGFDVSFGIQGALVGAAMLLVIPMLHIFGSRMRAYGGPLRL